MMPRAHRARRAELLRQREEWYWRWFSQIFFFALFLYAAMMCIVGYVVWHFLGKAW